MLKTTTRIIIIITQVFWDLAQGRLANSSRCFGRDYCLHLQGHQHRCDSLLSHKRILLNVFIQCNIFKYYDFFFY
jgi:hypothetical protein